MAAFLAVEDIAGICKFYWSLCRAFFFSNITRNSLFVSYEHMGRSNTFWYRGNINEESLFFQVYRTMTCNRLFRRIKGVLVAKINFYPFRAFIFFYFYKRIYLSSSVFTKMLISYDTQIRYISIQEQRDRYCML